MAIKPCAVFLPCLDQDVIPGSGNLLALLFRTPSRRVGPHAYQMSACMDERAEDEIVVHAAVAICEALNHPKTGVDVLVQLELPQLGNELTKVFWPNTELSHLPVDDSQLDLLAVSEGRVGYQYAVGDLVVIKGISWKVIVTYFPVQKSPWMTCSFV